MSYAARIVHLKEVLIGFYRQHANILDPLIKGIFSLLVLLVLCHMFPYGSVLNHWLLCLGLAAVQAFLPIITLFFMGSALILSNAFYISLDIFGIFMILLLICLLAFIRVDGKYTVIMFLTPILFVLKLEYLLPVILGITVGYGGILPCAGGIVLYFFSLYAEDASMLLTTSANSELGTGLQRMIDMVSIDKHLIVVIVVFSLIIFLSAGLYRLLFERAWMAALVIGNITLALMMLLGQWTFELDISILRIFLESFAGMGIAGLIQLFKGIGDVSRIEKISFEDDEYIYYVKAVPKIKMTHEQVNEKIIN